MINDVDGTEVLDQEILKGPKLHREWRWDIFALSQFNEENPQRWGVSVWYSDHDELMTYWGRFLENREDVFVRKMTRLVSEIREVPSGEI